MKRIFSRRITSAVTFKRCHVQARRPAPARPDAAGTGTNTVVQHIAVEKNIALTAALNGDPMLHLDVLRQGVTRG